MYVYVDPILKYLYAEIVAFTLLLYDRRRDGSES